MTWFVGFFLTIGILVLAVLKGIDITKKRKKAQKDKVWNDQLDSLLQSLKKS